MSTINIRKATQNDLPVLLQFEQGIITTERPFDPTLKEGHINYYDISEMIDSDMAEVLVAEIDTEIIASGYAKIVDAKPYRKYEQYSYLGFMFVAPEHRGKKVNRLIIDGLIHWSLSRGLTEIRLEVYAENAGAIRAYENAGFSQNIIEMRMDVSDKR